MKEEPKIKCPLCGLLVHPDRIYDKSLHTSVEVSAWMDAGWRPKFVEVLADMVNQHCSYEGNFYLGGDEDCKGPTIHCELDSMALSANASAMRLLAQEGRIKIESEYGRRIGANWIKPLPSPPADKKEGGQ